MDIGKRIREARRGVYKQKELAALVPVHDVTLSNYERGVNLPPLEVLERIAELTQRSLAWFFLEDGYEIVSTAPELDQKKALALIRQGLDFLETTHLEHEQRAETDGPSPASVRYGEEDKSSNDPSVGFGRGTRKLPKAGTEPASDTGG